jgi:hypothetical protein
MVYPYSFTEIGVGCIVHPIDYWDNEPDELADHPECLPWAPYQRAIELVKTWIAENRES